jgi:alpha-mannosidase
LGKVKTIYVCNHSHTDIGFTDYQDVAFRQHGQFIEQALDLIKATDDYPDGARYSWTCKTTRPLTRYLRSASADQVARFQHWHKRGRIDVWAIEHPGKSLPLDGHRLRVNLDPLAVATVLVKFNPESKRSHQKKRRAKSETWN